MKFALGSHAGGFVLEVCKGTVALGDEKQRLEAVCLLAHVMHQTHEVRLRREVPNPDCVAWQPTCLSASETSGGRSEMEKTKRTALSWLPRRPTNNI